MVFVFGDAEYIRNIGSPLAKVSSAIEHDESVRWYHAAFASQLAAA
jgi:hypothetical protein